jgi:hypothetical protein
MVDGAVVDAANARTNERKEARMHEKFVFRLSPDTSHLFLDLATATPGVFEPC